MKLLYKHLRLFCSFSNGNNNTRKELATTGYAKWLGKINITPNTSMF